jgi:hypothetical protein
MKTAIALEHFGSQSEIARQIGRTRQYVGQWGDIVPFRMAIRLQDLSNNKIKVDLDCYKSSLKSKRK